MSKRVGFWFFVGDWMKDPELRFCSIFARGLFIDLLCLMFESARQGELCKPDGSPRSDNEIVDAISGGNREEKVRALRELEVSGALKRDKNTGVLYSKRIKELAQLSETRAAARRGKGTKQATSEKQKPSFKATKKDQNEIKNGGVTVSDSDSDSDSDISSFLPSREESLVTSSLEERSQQNKFPLCTSMISTVNVEVAEAFRRWLSFQFVKTGRNMPEMQQDVLLMDLARRGAEKAVADIDFSIRVGAKNILDSSMDLQKAKQSSEAKSYGQTLKDKVGI